MSGLDFVGLVSPEISSNYNNLYCKQWCPPSIWDSSTNMSKYYGIRYIYENPARTAQNIATECLERYFSGDYDGFHDYVNGKEYWM